MAENTKTAGTQTNAAAFTKPVANKTPKAQANAGKAAAERPNASPAPKTKGPKKKVSGALVVGLLFVFLIAAGLGMLYFDLYGVKDFAVNAFALEDPTKKQLDAVSQKLQALAAKEKELADREAAFAVEQDKQQQEQKQLNKDLKAREKTVTDKEENLAELEAKIAQRQAELDALAASLEIKRIDISTAVQMFAGMEPDKAADALEGIANPADIALLLLYMDSEKSAAILDEMKTKLATSVMMEIATLKVANDLPPAPSPTPSSKK